MTLESGSKRHPAGYYRSEPVAVPAYPGDPTTIPGEPVWTTHRTLDPVRAAALTASVAIACAQIKAGGATTIEIIARDAHTLEQYLTGEEAHAPNPPS